MKRKRFSVEHITTVLQQAESGVLIGDLGHQVGISEQSFYRWRKVYGNLQPSEARELKPPRDENKKLKRLVADLSLDKGRPGCFSLPGRGMSVNQPSRTPARSAGTKLAPQVGLEPTTLRLTVAAR